MFSFHSPLPVPRTAMTTPVPPSSSGLSYRV